MFKVNLIVCQVLSAVCQFNSIEEAVSAVQIVLQSGVPIARIGIRFANVIPIHDVSISLCIMISLLTFLRKYLFSKNIIVTFNESFFHLALHWNVIQLSDCFDSTKVFSVKNHFAGKWMLVGCLDFTYQQLSVLFG